MGIYKKHNKSCQCRSAGSRKAICSCPWWLRYNDHLVSLAKWSTSYLDPSDRSAADAVANRVRVAIDEGRFSPEGEKASIAGDLTLAEFIDQVWLPRHARARGLSEDGLGPMLGVLKASPLGARKFHDLDRAGLQIQNWLFDQRQQRKWSTKTWKRRKGLAGARVVTGFFMVATFCPTYLPRSVWGPAVRLAWVLSCWQTTPALLAS